MRSYYRLVHLRIGHLRRLGSLRLAAMLLIGCAAAAAHITIACKFVDVQPDDSKGYIQLATNLTQNGVFSNDPTPPFSPTLVRLPGYPTFLAAIYKVFGVGNELAVRVSQALIYTLTCFLGALVAANWSRQDNRRSRAGLLAFILAAFCPFVVIYAATVLTEILTTFFFVAMLLAATYAIKTRRRRRSVFWWTAAGLLGAAGVMLRPDAGLFAFGAGLTLTFSVFWGRERFLSRLGDRLLKGVIYSVAFAVLFVPWTIRNERLFGVFQPLAPAHAEKPGEFVPHGYFLWLRTWIDDPRYIEPMLWNLEVRPIKIDDIPPNAFASEAEKQEVASLLDQYNNSDPEHPPPKAVDERSKPDDADDSSDDSDDAADETADNSDKPADTEELNLKISPEVDSAFEQLAQQRIGREPWRFYVLLPAKRMSTMWFDTHSDHYPFSGELFPLSDLDENIGQQYWLPLFAGLTWAYTFLLGAGLCMLLVSKAPRSRIWFLLIILVCLPRIVFFGTLENPEPRYLIELFLPAAILGGMFLSRIGIEREPGKIGLEIDLS